MPFVEEKHLVDFHRHLEEKEISEERLARELKQQRLINRKYRKTYIRLVGSLISCLVLMVVGFLVYLLEPSFLFHEKSPEQEKNMVILNKGEWLQVQDSLQGRSKELDELKNVLHTLDYRALGQELVYTVQVAALVNDRVSLASEDLLNMAVYKDLEYSKYSLGNFTKLEDAVKLRDALLKLGFKDAFIASYKGGKRLKIEESDIHE